MQLLVGVVTESVVECVFGVLLTGLQVGWLFWGVWPTVFDGFLLAVRIQQDCLVEIGL